MRMPWEIAAQADRRKQKDRRWVNLGDIQPPRPPEPSGLRAARRQSEKEGAPLASFFGKPCPYCNVEMAPTPAWPVPLTNKSSATRDHAFPRRAGWGLNDFDGANRIICCYGCNQAKGARDIVEWYARLVFGRDARAAIVLGVIRQLAGAATFPANIMAKLNDVRGGLSAARAREMISQPRMWR